MKTLNFYKLLVVSSFLIQSCGHKKLNNFPAVSATAADQPAVGNHIGYPNLAEYNHTKGYWENGDLIREFDCPDSRFFPPIALRSWQKTPVVNGRFPTYAETKNGSAIHHYGEKENADIRLYGMTLPKLAYLKRQGTGKKELVVVIQVVRSATDTIVGYRYLTGGCGGSPFHNYHFLTDGELKKELGK